jgi:hypothetical protein
LLLMNPPLRKVLLVMVTPPAPIVPALVTPPLKFVALITIALVWPLNLVGYGPLNAIGALQRRVIAPRRSVTDRARPDCCGAGVLEASRAVQSRFSKAC